MADTGVVSGFYWAYCNDCEWKSESTYTWSEAERLRTEHLGSHHDGLPMSQGDA